MLDRIAAGQFPFEEANRHLVEAAIRNEETISRTAREMREIERQLRERVEGLPDWIAGEVDRRLAAAVNRTGSQVSAQLSGANEAATRAQAAYENAVKFAMWRITLLALICFLVGCIGMIGGLYISARLLLPAPDILQREREAEQTVAKLVARGGDSELTQCAVQGGPSRLCIRTDERDGGSPWKGNHGETYRVIFGY
jgi:hypothetical protein